MKELGGKFTSDSKIRNANMSLKDFLLFIDVHDIFKLAKHENAEKEAKL
jgi:hypothetical protein